MDRDTTADLVRADVQRAHRYPHLCPHPTLPTYPPLHLPFTFTHAHCTRGVLLHWFLLPDMTRTNALRSWVALTYHLG